MSDEQQRFRNIWARMDSDADGEASNAFMAIRQRLREARKRFIDLLDIVERNVSLDAYNTLERDLTEARARLAAFQQENVLLKGDNAQLRGRLAQTGIVVNRWTKIESYASWGKGALFGLVMALMPIQGVATLVRTPWWTNAWNGVSLMAGADTRHDALQRIADGTPWNVGDTDARVFALDGPGSAQRYWVMLHRWMSSATRVDESDRPVTQYCTAVYLDPAEADPQQPGLYETPRIYDGDMVIQFHHAFDSCVSKPGPHAEAATPTETQP
jgi:hypothetical protein